jgi:hypothetical protein
MYVEIYCIYYTLKVFILYAHILTIIIINTVS